MDKKQSEFEEFAELLAGNYDALSLARALISATNRNIEHEILHGVQKDTSKPIGLMNYDFSKTTTAAKSSPEVASLPLRGFPCEIKDPFKGLTT